MVVFFRTPRTQYTYLYSRLAPAKTIVTCVHKKNPLSNLLELLVSADATAISKKIIFLNFLQGVKKGFNSKIKAKTEKKRL